MKLKSLSLVFLLILSLQLPGEIVKAQTIENPLIAEIGENIGNINESEEIYYTFNGSIAQYEISLTGADVTDFDLYLYDSEYNVIETSRETYYPEIVSDFSISESTYIIKISAFQGSGSYNLTITEKPIATLSTSVETGKFSESNQQHYYQLNTTEGIYNLTLNGEASFYLKLYNQDFDLISYGSGYNHKEIIFYAKGNETYFALVDSGYYNGVYDLQLQVSDVDIISPGKITGTIENGDTQIYYVNLDDGMYYFKLSAGLDTNFDLYLRSFSSSYLIAESTNDDSSEFISYRSQSSRIAVLYISSYYGDVGQFELTFTEVLNEEIPVDYASIDEYDDFDLYKIDNAKNKEIQLDLSMKGDIHYAAIVNSDLDIHILTALILVSDNSANPRNLADTYTNFEGVYGNHSLAYTSAYDTVWVVVYTNTFLTDGYTDMATGYKLESNLPLISTQASSDYENYYPYTKTGHLKDNGDEYWDNGEFIIYTGYSVASGDTFDLIIDAGYTYDEIIVLLFDGTSEEDINDALSAIRDYYYYDDPLPADFITVRITTDGFAFLSHYFESGDTFNVALFFNLPYYDASASFTLYSSHQGKGTIIASNSSASQNIIGFMSALLILPILYRHKFKR